MNPTELEQALRSAPYLTTLGLRVEEVRPGHVVLRLPISAPVTNHGGALHTGAIFAIGEVAAQVALATHPTLAGFLHLQKSTKIKYYLPSNRDVTAHCSVEPETVAAAQQIARTGYGTTVLSVKVLDGNGRDVAELAASYSFKSR